MPIDANDSPAAEKNTPQSAAAATAADNINVPGPGNFPELYDAGVKNPRLDTQSNFIAASGGKVSAGPDVGIDGMSGAGAGSLPDLYKLRVMPNRSGVAQRHGATPESEKAVQIALDWLANSQADDGRWDPAEHNAGRELSVQGRNRLNAGSKAGSGITGLALLAFLAGGHTHQTGPYAANVRRGLEFLLRTQAPDGSLGGNGQAFEFMYCHAMAACALSEAYGMTHDTRLEKPVRRAIAFTVSAQDPRGGGWRYRPGDPGDTSQLGWQLMALKSAALAGIPMPPSTRAGIIRFLRSVSSGKQGGLASYRPGEAPSRSMSAEALVCWQFLGLPREHPACNEAGDYLLTELPGGSAQRLLLVLCHHRHVPITGRLLAALERSPAIHSACPTGQGRPAGRFLEYRHALGRLRRPRLYHRHRHAGPGGVLPLSAPLRRNRLRRQVIAVFDSHPGSCTMQLESFIINSVLIAIVKPRSVIALWACNVGSMVTT